MRIPTNTYASNFQFIYKHIPSYPPTLIHTHLTLKHTSHSPSYTLSPPSPNLPLLSHRWWSCICLAYQVSVACFLDAHVVLPLGTVIHCDPGRVLDSVPHVASVTASARVDDVDGRCGAHHDCTHARSIAVASLRLYLHLESVLMQLRM
jgi:hypothetical protein